VESGGFLCLLLLPLMGSTALAQPVIYVDTNATGPVHDGTSWCRAHLYLQDALAEAEASGGAVTEIRVADGVYKPDQGAGMTPGDRFATFQLLNGVAIRGGYAGCGAPDPDERDIAAYETILSGDLNGDDVGDVGGSSQGDNTFHVVTAEDADHTTVLDGATITAGRAMEYAGGMLNRRSNATMIDCTFRKNRARLGGAMANRRGSPTLYRCVFESNGYIRSPGAGGALWNDVGSPILIDCVFRGNTATQGGAIHNSAGNGLLAVNCVFSGNVAALGGAIDNWASAPTLINCTFVGNRAGSLGGAFHDINQVHGTPRFANCVLWGNTDLYGAAETAQLFHDDIGGPGTFLVDYSNVQGWTGDLGGVGNIGDDPLFVGPGHWDDNGTPDNRNDDIWIDGDYRLQAGSPCIDAGDNTAVPVDLLTDLAGRLRFVDDPSVPDTGYGWPPIVDMGAYERQLTLLLDIHPGQCPNRLNVKSNARVRMAIAGMDVLDVTQIDTESLVLQRADGVGGSLPAGSWCHGSTITVTDAATPFYGELCDCHSRRGDGIDDLVLTFWTRDIVRELELRGIGPKTPVMLTVRGQLLDGTSFEASDCILTIGGGRTVSGRLSSSDGKD
jgi:hypothetical protein